MGETTLATKCCAPVLRTASCPAKLAGPIAVRSTPASLAGGNNCRRIDGVLY
jgi:hypothetical protein